MIEMGYVMVCFLSGTVSFSSRTVGLAIVFHGLTKKGERHSA
jgi:hypothetical protein